MGVRLHLLSRPNFPDEPNEAFHDWKDQEKKNEEILMRFDNAKWWSRVLDGIVMSTAVLGLYE